MNITSLNPFFHRPSSFLTRRHSTLLRLAFSLHPHLSAFSVLPWILVCKGPEARPLPLTAFPEAIWAIILEHLQSDSVGEQPHFLILEWLLPAASAPASGHPWPWRVRDGLVIGRVLHCPCLVPQPGLLGPLSFQPFPWLLSVGSAPLLVSVTGDRDLQLSVLDACDQAAALAMDQGIKANKQTRDWG